MLQSCVSFFLLLRENLSLVAPLAPPAVLLVSDNLLISLIVGGNGVSFFETNSFVSLRGDIWRSSVSLLTFKKEDFGLSLDFDSLTSSFFAGELILTFLLFFFLGSLAAELSAFCSFFFLGATSFFFFFCLGEGVRSSEGSAFVVLFCLLFEDEFDYLLYLGFYFSAVLIC